MSRIDGYLIRVLVFDFMFLGINKIRGLNKFDLEEVLIYPIIYL